MWKDGKGGYEELLKEMGKGDKEQLVDRMFSEAAALSTRVVSELEAKLRPLWIWSDSEQRGWSDPKTLFETANTSMGTRTKTTTTPTSAGTRPAGPSPAGPIPLALVSILRVRYGCFPPVASAGGGGGGGCGKSDFYLLYLNGGHCTCTLSTRQVRVTIREGLGGGSETGHMGDNGDNNRQDQQEQQEHQQR